MSDRTDASYKLVIRTNSGTTNAALEVLQHIELDRTCQFTIAPVIMQEHDYDENAISTAYQKGVIITVDFYALWSKNHESAVLLSAKNLISGSLKTSVPFEAALFTYDIYELPDYAVNFNLVEWKLVLSTPEPTL